MFKCYLFTRSVLLQILKYLFVRTLGPCWRLGFSILGLLFKKWLFICLRLLIFVNCLFFRRLCHFDILLVLNSYFPVIIFGDVLLIVDRSAIMIALIPPLCIVLVYVVVRFGDFFIVLTLFTWLCMLKLLFYRRCMSLLSEMFVIV